MEEIHNEKCLNCLFSDVCDFGQPCSDYAPIEPDEQVERARAILKKRRFREQFWEYLDGWES